MKHSHYATIHHKNASDEIIICSPDDDILLLISFWDGKPDSARAIKTANCIVDSLNNRRHKLVPSLTSHR